MASYKSQPLEKALQTAFSEALALFGKPYQPGQASAKVAVTSATKEGRVLLLSNYNRKPASVGEQDQPSSISNLATEICLHDGFVKRFIVSIEPVLRMI